MCSLPSSAKSYCSFQQHKQRERLLARERGEKKENNTPLLMTLFGLQSPKVNESLGEMVGDRQMGGEYQNSSSKNLSKASFVPAGKHTHTGTSLGLHSVILILAPLLFYPCSAAATPSFIYSTLIYSVHLSNNLITVINLCSHLYTEWDTRTHTYSTSSPARLGDKHILPHGKPLTRKASDRMTGLSVVPKQK